MNALVTLSTKLHRHWLSLGILLSLFALLVGSTRVQSHGSMEVPISRGYNCYLEGPEAPIPDACKVAVHEGGTQALYDWNGVNRLANNRHRQIIPSGKLCSAGKASHKGLDLPRRDWVATTIIPDQTGNYEFVFRATAPHSTDYFKFYVTKDNFDPIQALRWEDLEPMPFCTIDDVTLENGRYRMHCPLPVGKSGKHVIYSIWQRDDIAEAFYSCSDVVFNDDAITTMREIGQIRAQQDQTVGSTVIFRLFDNAYGDVESYSVTLENGMNSADEWPFQLAQIVNANFALVNIGILNDLGDVIPIKSAIKNRVYVRSNFHYSFEIDVDLPDVVDNPDLTSWEPNAIYVVGDTVLYKSQRYRAKWWNRGDHPIPNPVVEWRTPWKLLAPTPSSPDSPDTNIWISTGTYFMGDVVTHNGIDYRAKWWNRDFAPDTIVDFSWETP